LHDRQLPGFLNDPSDAVHTRTAREVDRALHHLLFDRKVNVLGLNGGDGTLHLGLNRLVILQQQVYEQLGVNMTLPRLLFLNGGTLNVVSRATGTKGNPARTVRDFQRRYSNATLAQVQSASLRVLVTDVSTAEGHLERRYGFVFGSELVANALEMYGMFGEGYGGLLRFFSEVALGYTLNTRLWQEHGWKLDAPTSSISLDGSRTETYLAAVASTIDLSLVKGALTALKACSGQGYAVRVLTETNPGAVIRSIPKLLVGAKHKSIIDVAEAGELKVFGGYTLDGEVFLDRTPKGQSRLIRVGLAPFRVQGIAL
jgi:hypothetical protein